MNSSGIKPMEYNVLVLPKEVETKTAGGIILPDDKLEKDEFARMEGVLVAVSPLAFTYADWPDASDIPKVGQRVLFSRYQATEIRGADGGKYWLMKDKSIAGVFEA
ncbi:co-chaperone GroES [Yoonia sp. R2331]|uniref:co-chaperone GroES n=1 Tax=Yoonia sp. R2331 TaxID=3237238 RepID=UPI0034E4AB64